MKHIIIIAILSICAIFVHGYQFAVSDQEIFIPYILKSADTSLFPGDALFNQSSAHLSIFYPLIGITSKFIDIQIVFFVGYLIFQFIFFAAIYRLSKILLKEQNLAYLSLLPFLLPKFIGGTATFTYDTSFGYRSFGVIALLFYLSYLLEKKFTKTTLVALFGLLFHPLSIVPNLFLLPALKLKDLRPQLKQIIKYSAIMTALGVALLLILKIILEYPLFLKDDLWLSIIKSRASYLFISTWSLKGWGAIVLYLLLIVFSLNKLHKSLKTPVIMITSTSLILFLVHYFILEIMHVPAVAQLQLLRSISPIVYIGLAVSPLLFVHKNLKRRVIGAAVFIALCVNLNNLSYISDLNLQNRIQFPKKESDWINLQKWVSDNTATTDKVLVPPKQTGFRIFSKRPIVGDIKDGAVVIYSPEYALYWNSLMGDLKDYDNYDDEDSIKLKDKYNFNYIVTKKDNKLKLSPIYKNNTYSLYKL